LRGFGLWWGSFGMLDLNRAGSGDRAGDRF
jgi:hypothetical protein